MARLKLWCSVWIGLNSLHPLASSVTQSVSFFTDGQLLQLVSPNFFLIFGPRCLISLFSGATQNLWRQLRNPLTRVKLALVFREMIRIDVLPFWPGSIMVCLYVVFFNYPSAHAGSRTKLKRKTGWHNTMQTSYQLVFTSCRNIGRYGHSETTYYPLPVIQSRFINFRTWMFKTRSIYIATRSRYCIIVEQMSFILPFMRLAAVLQKAFLLMDQCSPPSLLGSWFAPALHAQLDPSGRPSKAYNCKTGYPFR